MCREKKTGMAEECRQSERKRALRACTECRRVFYYWEPVEFSQKRCDMIIINKRSFEAFTMCLDPDKRH